MSKTTDEYNHVCIAIKRWQSRYKRAVTMLAKLEQKRKRLDKKMIQEGREWAEAHRAEVAPGIKQAAPMGMCNDGEVVVEPKPSPVPMTNEELVAFVTAPSAEVDLEGVPDFLRRRNEEEARAQVQAEVDAEKKRKADIAAEKRKVKKEIIKADLTGQRRKMPLTGRAALEALK